MLLSMPCIRSREPFEPRMSQVSTREAKPRPRRFLRLGRGALMNVDAIGKIDQLPGGSYLVT